MGPSHLIHSPQLKALPLGRVRSKTQFQIILSFVLVALGLSLFWIASADALCISERRANLRQGPGLNYDKLWEVYRYMPFRQLGRKGEWLRVQDLDGDIYWVHRRLTTKSFKCAVIKKNKINLRRGPGTKYKKVKGIPGEKYYSMKVLKVKGNWVQVVDAWGDKAWIYKPLVWIK